VPPVGVGTISTSGGCAWRRRVGHLPPEMSYPADTRRHARELRVASASSKRRSRQRVGRCPPAERSDAGGHSQGRGRAGASRRRATARLCPAPADLIPARPGERSEPRGGAGRRPGRAFMVRSIFGRSPLDSPWQPSPLKRRAAVWGNPKLERSEDDWRHSPTKAVTLLADAVGAAASRWQRRSVCGWNCHDAPQPAPCACAVSELPALRRVNEAELHWRDGNPVATERRRNEVPPQVCEATRGFGGAKPPS